MKKSTIACYAVASVAIVAAVGYVLMPSLGETPETQSGRTAVPGPGAAEDIKEEIVGVWVSTDDAKYSVTYRADGTLTERYESETGAGTPPLVDTNGRWVIMVVDDSVMLGTSVNGETFSYAIIEFRDGSMTLRDADAIRDNHFRKTD